MTTKEEKNWFSIGYIEKKEYNRFKALMENEKVFDYIVKKLYVSFKSLNFSNKLCDDLLKNLLNLNFDEFHKTHDDEIRKLYIEKFFKEDCAQYYSKFVIPMIEDSKKILDIGCGIGVLASELAKSKKFEKILGCEWSIQENWEKEQEKYDNLNFFAVNNDYFFQFLKEHKPNYMVLTWV
jgi:2-polyprenyl-3-methyl-5-hydroxy-6-metoxy-1,4-benzoquinol methylase